MSTRDRLHSLDAVRAFALLLGVVFHAAFSFIPGMIPGVWAIVDTSPSTTLSVVAFVSHIFRMSLFFFVAGIFGRMLYHRDGVRGFWANRTKRILLPLVTGWLVVFPAIAVVWVWGLTKTFGGSLPTPPADIPPPPAAAFPLTHLWFLYYLLVLYILVVSCRTIVAAADRTGSLRRFADACVRRLIDTGAAPLVLAAPVTAALYFREQWISFFGIPTPDRSLIPEASSLVAYGTALASGWLVHRQIEVLQVWRRQWPLQLAGALGATVACLWMAGPTPSFVPVAAGPQKLALAFCYGIAIWCWSFALIGIATRFLSSHRPAVRYVADASYWIYIVHLPVVVAVQVAVGHLPWHWTMKFPGILAVSFLLLFASYRYLVRPTYIGQLLNGRRYPRAHRLPPAAATPESSAPSDADPAVPDAHAGDDPPSSLATLAAVHKRYGTTTALAGLDLDSRRGELLAVLGPNGAGKSTAISLWLGLLEPDTGEVRLLGRSPDRVESRRHIGVMMQEVGLTPELRVRELIELTASYYPEPWSTPQTLQLAGILALADRLYSRLSAGQKRQVQFALAICGRPAVLFLDEPTVGLDVEARETMWRTIREMVGQGCSVVLTTHYLEEAEALADRVAVMAGGRVIAAGSVDEIRSVVSRKQISCSTVLTADEVRGWPHVAAVEPRNGRLQITVLEAEIVLRRLLASDASVRDVEVRQAGLAQAFVELTKEAA